MWQARTTMFPVGMAVHTDKRRAHHLHSAENTDFVNTAFTPCRRSRAEADAQKLDASSLLMHGEKELAKKHSPYFLWGQMSSWFKQVGAGLATTVLAGLPGKPHAGPKKKKKERETPCRSILIPSCVASSQLRAAWHSLGCQHKPATYAYDAYNCF